MIAAIDARKSTACLASPKGLADFYTLVGSALKAA
jgi:hypothetical protein